ncbi:hypothetical protein [Cytobacillus gottheilii]|uniref:Uncharacterized protein n=1 Tax=Cytobacillus gottheilii TaxID=859144 RepID=A0ABX8FB81_9BACI|nr:hypothetical protein [Cytobacillus gottheilii]QVY61284.1 hypothetical protein J1899_20390 [Cytobacillus gottheilii]
MLTQYQFSQVARINNEYGDEVEIELMKHPDYYRVVATICEDSTPFKDYIGIGLDNYNQALALRQAIHKLHWAAYRSCHCSLLDSS